MKKLLLAILVLGSFIACKKENKSLESGVQTTNEQPESSPVSSINLTEFSPDKVSNLLKSKQNDTLYITNFFATWCGPCMREIPHFKEKMEELKNQPVKFTFVSLDNKEDWNEAVRNFAEENNLAKNVVLLDGVSLTPEFFKQNFKNWDGGSIPFTTMKKGDKVEEVQGSMSKEELESKISDFKISENAAKNDSNEGKKLNSATENHKKNK